MRCRQVCVSAENVRPARRGVRDRPGRLRSNVRLRDVPFLEAPMRRGWLEPLRNGRVRAHHLRLPVRNRLGRVRRNSQLRHLSRTRDVRRWHHRQRMRMHAHDVCTAREELRIVSQRLRSAAGLRDVPAPGSRLRFERIVLRLLRNGRGQLWQLVPKHGVLRRGLGVHLERLVLVLLRNRDRQLRQELPSEHVLPPRRGMRSQRLMLRVLRPRDGQLRQRVSAEHMLRRRRGMRFERIVLGMLRIGGRQLRQELPDKHVLSARRWIGHWIRIGVRIMMCVWAAYPLRSP